MRKKMIGIVIGAVLMVGAGCGGNNSSQNASNGASFNPDAMSSCMEQNHDADACHAIWDR
jgi:hypothetical protein